MKRLFSLIVTVIVFLLSACENLVEEEGPIEYSKPSSVEVSASNSRESLDITLTASPNGQSVKSVASASFAYSFSENLADATTVNAVADGDAFTATFRSLDYGKRIYFQATIVSAFGSQMTSSVWNILVPAFSEFVKVSAPELVEATSSSIILKSDYQSPEGIAIAERGFCWSAELAVPSIENSRVVAESAFQCAIEGLEQMQTINARAYVKDASGNIAYSEVEQFTTDAVHVSEVSLNKTELQLNEGEAQTLVATVKPDDAANQAVSWKSSDTGVATVDANGKVTAVKAGKATITVTTEDSGKTATCEVTVKALVGGIELNKTSLTLNEGASETLIATVKPENASNKNVGWKSSDTSVATVDANGKVTAVKAGTATITVTTEDGGKTATCEVTVIAPVVSISLNKTTLSLTEGSTETLTVTFKPENTSNKNVSWKSSDTSVATVDANGKVTAVKAGTATITVTTVDGAKTASCVVTVSSSSSTSCWHENETYYWREYQTPIVKWNTYGQGGTIDLSDLMTYVQAKSVKQLMDLGLITDVSVALLYPNVDSPYFSPSVNGHVITISQTSTQVYNAPNADHMERLRLISGCSEGHYVRIDMEVLCKVDTSSSIPEYVDLGLSVKWATCNLGASKPEGYGSYYQWAGTKDVTSRSIYLDWDNAPYQTNASAPWGSYTEWSKYVGSTTSSYKDASATDKDALKTVLDPEDDAAHVVLGGKWRMPTYAEWTELRENCIWTWTTVDGINGYRVTSKKSGYTDKSIFLPAAGYRSSGDLNSVGSYGSYWSSSLSTTHPFDAYSVNFNSSNVSRYYYSRYYGQSIRPVSE